MWSRVKPVASSQDLDGEARDLHEITMPAD
jgi:hypothetical protein